MLGGAGKLGSGLWPSFGAGEWAPASGPVRRLRDWEFGRSDKVPWGPPYVLAAVELAGVGFMG
jgi:hypothetical protein